MAHVNGRTLQVSIQAVNSVIKDLEQERDEVRGTEQEVEVIEMLLAYANAANNLEKAYAEELHHADNLRPMKA